MHRRNDQLPDDPSDAELVARLSRGDSEALGDLFVRHHEDVLRLCHRLTGDPRMAEDLAQDCFVRLARLGGSFRGDAAFSTWLYRLTRNVCMDHLNAVARTRRRDEAAAREWSVTRDGISPSDHREDALRKALDSLSPEKREVLVLSRYQGLSYAEIAEVCGTTTGAIKVRAHRAMRALRQRIEELELAR